MIDEVFHKGENILMQAAKMYPCDIFVYFVESIKKLFDNHKNWEKFSREESHLGETV